jgi:hypothetical protein
MRSILLMLCIALAGCGNDDGTAADMSIARDLSYLHCSQTCSTCAAGTTCVTGMDDFNAACLKSCTDQRDCPSGSQCASLKAAAGMTRWCIDQSAPTKNCGIGCAVGSEERCVGDVAVHGGGFFAYCATVYEYCPHGCAIGDGSVYAKCNP